MRCFIYQCTQCTRSQVAQQRYVLYLIPRHCPPLAYHSTTSCLFVPRFTLLLSMFCSVFEYIIYTVALTTNVSRMYWAVLLDELDKDLLRFVWRRSPLSLSVTIVWHKLLLECLLHPVLPTWQWNKMLLTSPLIILWLQELFKILFMLMMDWLARILLKKQSSCNVNNKSYFLVVDSLYVSGIQVILSHWSTFQMSSRICSHSVHYLILENIPRRSGLKGTHAWIIFVSTLQNSLHLVTSPSASLFQMLQRPLTS